MDGSAESQVHKMSENRLPARKFLRRELFDLSYILARKFGHKTNVSVSGIWGTF